MTCNRHRPREFGGSAPATPGFNAVAPEWLLNYGAADAAPAFPAAESTLGSHPCVALSSAQVRSEWTNPNPAGNVLASAGDNPLNFVSQPRGSLHEIPLNQKLLETLRTYWRWMRPKTYLFPGTENGWRADKPITPKVIWEAVQETAKRAGITKHVTPHTLRHCVASSA